MLPLARTLYSAFLKLYESGIKIASGQNEKAKLWVKGRENIFEKIERQVQGEGPLIWFHCASLGEFEQGRLLIEKIKNEHPDTRILLTFFSPSGYEQRRNYRFADYVFYLPMDSRRHASRFLKLVKPDLAVFVKYEFWYYYFEALRQRNIPLLLVSGIFRREQPFFKWYGWLQRRMLQCITYFFVQDNTSVQLLNGLGFHNLSLIPDTRIDRVAQIAADVKPIPTIAHFLNGEKAFIGGSIYTHENEIIYQAWKQRHIPGKLILVPHQVDAAHIEEVTAVWGNEIELYTHFAERMQTDKRILLVNTVGLLSAMYQYGRIAFIGGGFGKGIHNTLEPAAFGLPILFGPNYHKFIEAKEMLAQGGAFVVRNTEEFNAVLKQLSTQETYQAASQVTRDYIQSHTGGTDIVYRWIKAHLRVL